MTRQANLLHMLNVLCCRVEGGKWNMAQDKSKWQFLGWSDMVGVKQHKWKLELVSKTPVRNPAASSASSGVLGVFGRLRASPGVFGRLRASSASSGVFGVFGRLRASSGVFGRLRASSASSASAASSAQIWGTSAAINVYEDLFAKCRQLVCRGLLCLVWLWSHDRYVVLIPLIHLHGVRWKKFGVIMLIYQCVHLQHSLFDSTAVALRLRLLLPLSFCVSGWLFLPWIDVHKVLFRNIWMSCNHPSGQAPH